MRPGHTLREKSPSELGKPVIEPDNEARPWLTANSRSLDAALALEPNVLCCSHNAVVQASHTRDVLAAKKTRNLQRAHFSLTHATPLLPAPTLSEGECRVSAG
jgi:hypothetical protein